MNIKDNNQRTEIGGFFHTNKISNQGISLYFFVFTVSLKHQQSRIYFFHDLYYIQVKSLIRKYPNYL